MKLHQSGKEAEWIATPIEARTFWQRLAYRTHGTVTPGNITSVLGGVLVFWGLYIVHTQATFGILLVIVGRLADIADGILADRSKTKSPLGEAVDATMDKFTAAGVLIIFVHDAMLPLIPALCIAVQLGLNAALALYARVRHITMHPSKFGKISAFIAWGALLLFPVASRLHAGSIIRLLIETLAYALFGIFVILGSLATVAYLRTVTSRPRAH